MRLENLFLNEGLFFNFIVCSDLHIYNNFIRELITYTCSIQAFLWP